MEFGKRQNLNSAAAESPRVSNRHQGLPDGGGMLLEVFDTTEQHVSLGVDNRSVVSPVGDAATQRGEATSNWEWQAPVGDG